MLAVMFTMNLAKVPSTQIYLRFKAKLRGLLLTPITFALDFGAKGSIGSDISEPERRR